MSVFPLNPNSHILKPKKFQPPFLLAFAFYIRKETQEDTESQEAGSQPGSGLEMKTGSHVRGFFCVKYDYTLEYNFKGHYIIKGKSEHHY